ncbi:MAG TPA: nitroreductase [Caulobacteraceae bacterium]|nr:nitroreductase [Caulobacteraceae bacterium]
MHFDDVLRQRRSVRAFKPDPVPLALVRELLDCARRAPSGTNIQPWKVHVVAGAVRERLVAEVLAHRETSPHDTSAEFPRARRTEPYVGRARTLGKAMYSLIGIPRGDQAANWAQWGRNYRFFDAPVGLIFTIDKSLDCMSFLDTGMFIQNLLLAATSRGLGACPQGAWNAFWTVTRRVLGVPEDEWIVCGVSLGWPDETAPVNALLAEREPIEAFATFHGFEAETPSFLVNPGTA